MDEFQSHLQRLGTTLYELLSTSLGLHPSRIQELFGATEEHNTLVRSNLYPRCPEPELTVWAGAHSDASIITILLQNDVPGLQIRPQGRPWMLVPPVPGALVVNVGDCLEVGHSHASRRPRISLTLRDPRITFASHGICTPAGGVQCPLQEHRAPGRSEQWQRKVLFGCFLHASLERCAQPSTRARRRRKPAKVWLRQLLRVRPGLLQQRRRRQAPSESCAAQGG